MYTCEEKKKATENGTYIFNKVYDVAISEEKFFHKHFENPFCVETPFLIDYEDDKPVIMRWMMGMDMIYNSNKIKAVQSSDDAALPEVRGIGFIKIIKASEKIMKNNGTDLVYGCYYHGKAMEIALKIGEKNIVNLYDAKLPLGDNVYKWKRFNFPVPKCFMNLRAAKHIKKLKKSAKDCVCTIDVSDEIPFTDTDYELINSDMSLRVSRSRNYYGWKLSPRNKKDIKFITARKDNILTGFLIVVSENEKDTIVDWDVFAEGNEKNAILAAMTLKICNKKSIIAPSLNPESGEMALFTNIGFDDASLHSVPVYICAKAFNAELQDIIYNPKNWKHRPIDADYFLN